MAEKEFRAAPVYIVPIFASLLVGIACAFLVMLSEADLSAAVGFPEEGVGSLYTASLFVLAAGFGATMIYFLLKRGVYRFIRLLMGAAFSILSFSLVTLYSGLAVAVLNVSVPYSAVLFLAFLAAVFVVLEVFVRKGRFYVVIVLMLGGGAGALLGASIPVFSAVLILLFLAVYDVVAVFRGPVGKIAASGLEHLPGASFSFKDIHVGLGDLTFYSMLVSNMLLSFGWQVCIAAACGVLLGSLLSFKMVEKKGMFPGLPFSVLLGLFAGFVVSVLV